MLKYEINYSQLVRETKATTCLYEVLHGTGFVLGSAAAIVSFAILVASIIE